MAILQTQIINPYFGNRYNYNDQKSNGEQSFWEYIVDPYHCTNGGCGIFRIWHPEDINSDGKTGSIQILMVYVNILFQIEINQMGYYQLKILRTMDYTIVFTGGNNGVYKIDIDSSDPEKEFAFSAYDANA